MTSKRNSDPQDKINEIPSIDDRGHGRLHCQEQNSPEVRSGKRRRSPSRMQPIRSTSSTPIPATERKPHPMINKRFPLVLMLEPLHACNLTCTGCGRIREYESTIKEKLSVEECLASVDECGAPIVSICGGEPMIYPRDRRPGRRHPRAQQAHLPLHQRHVHPEEAARVSARPSASSSTSISTAWRRRTTCAVEREGVFTGRRRGHHRRQGRPASWSAPTPPSTRKPT